MEQCIAGPLLKGRTVLLVTHNVILASPFARYMVVLSSAGTVQSQGVVENLLKDNDILHAAEADELKHATGSKELPPENQAEEQNLLAQKGKQMTVEELAIGHIGWPVCECKNDECAAENNGWHLKTNSILATSEAPYSSLSWEF